MNDLQAIQPGAIILLHLNGNQIVVATYAGENELGIFVSSPLSLVARDNGGRLEFGTAPFLTLGGALEPIEQMLVPYSSILLPRACPDKLARLYAQALTPIDISAAHKSPLIRT